MCVQSNIWLVWLMFDIFNLSRKNYLSLFFPTKLSFHNDSDYIDSSGKWNDGLYKISDIILGVSF